MPENIKITQGIQFYYENDVQQSAIDQVIAISPQNKNVPKDLSWDEVEKYNDAKLSALSIQIDYWKLLNDVWKGTWGSVIDSSSFEEIETALYKKHHSLEYVWENYFYKAFAYGNSVFFCSCAIYSISMKIGFWIEGENGTSSFFDQLQLSDSWVEDGETGRLVIDNLVPIPDQQEINIDKLSKLAKEVMSKLEKAM